MTRSAHHKDGGNAYRTAMDKILEDRPPRIVWRSNGKGIQVAVFMNDPHTDRPWPQNASYRPGES